jgi:hypothetical protein
MDSSPSPSMLDHAHRHHHHHHQPPPQLIGQPNLYEQPVEDSENSTFTQHALVHSPATSQASSMANDLLSPPSSSSRASTDPASSGATGSARDSTRRYSGLPTEEELLRPALEGTRNILGCANRTKRVKRVVLTSSSKKSQEAVNISEY